MRGAIGVRINSGSSDKHVTNHVTGLKFSKSAPGGHASLTLTLKAELYDWLDLGQNDRVFVFNAATGATIWSGYTDAPTATKGDLGETFDLSALGGWSLMLDRTEKLIYIAAGPDLWVQEDLLPQVAGAQVSIPGTYPSGDRGPGGVDAGPDDDGRSCLLVQFPSGTPLVTGSQAGMRFYGFRDSPMSVGGFFGWYSTPGSSSALKWYGQPYVAGTAPEEMGNPLYTTPGFYAITELADSYPTALGAHVIRYGTDSIGFALYHSGGATTVSVDTYWAGIDPPTVVGQLVDENGALVDTGTAIADYANPALTADQVIADLIGRMLPFIDPAKAEIAASTYPIDAMSYPDGVTADGVFSDLNVLEPDLFAEVLEADVDTGLHRFRWRAWPDETTDGPRYVISIKDGFKRPGGDVALCNRMAVYWTDEKGTRRLTEVTVSVPELDTPALGPARTRDAEPYTLPDGLGSESNATQWGTASLEQANRGTSAGSAVVARRIRDVYTGAWVYPWEIEPGYLVQVMETQEIHRLTGVEYDDDSCSATLTLGDPVLSDEQRLAQLTRRGATTNKATR